MNGKKKGFIAGVIAGMIIFGALAFIEVTRAAAPSITYAYPSNGATFVSVWRGHGVNITVNVTDADGDLNKLVLKWNDSGTWKTFYDSGALGGVSYHNVTVLNSNFTGSWTTYEWQICAYDTSWTNTTYSFTTEYVWGGSVIIFGDFRASQNNMDLSVMYKNNTNDYYLWVGNASIDAKHSSQGWNWITISKQDITTGKYPYNAFTYNGQPYLYYYDSGYLKYVTWNGNSWINGNTNISQQGNTGYSHYYPKYAYGGDAKYYNGKWIVVAGYASTSGTSLYLRFYSSNSPISSLSYETTLDSGYQYESISNVYQASFMPSLNILNGKLILTYVDADRDLHWQVYDGVNWVDKGDIEADLGSGNEIQGHWQSAVKDPVNNQIVCVYINASGNMYYRTLTDPDGTWSEPHLIFQPESGYEIKYPHVQYIDHRIVITFAYNIRGNYNIYMITAPEYLSSASGILKQYNRIQFPDATPNQKNVNSSVFYFENINSRAINWINWSFSDIGSIQCENNIRLWGSTDNSTWVAIGTTDTNGYINMTSTAWAGGLPWQAGEIRYFKLEILDVGNVPEDLHSNDAGIVLKVGLA